VSPAGRSILIAHSVGVLHLSVLINNSGQDVKSLDLVAGRDLIGRAHMSTGSAQPVLDRAALRQYRDRLTHLAAEMDEHMANGNVDAATQARVGHDWLLSELSAATGIGGHTRNFPDSAERARTAVGKAVRRVLARINEAAPHIGRHLRESIRTGAVCSYRPT
jgi:hypothetical protein